MLPVVLGLALVATPEDVSYVAKTPHLAVERLAETLRPGGAVRLEAGSFAELPAPRKGRRYRAVGRSRAIRGTSVPVRVEVLHGRHVEMSRVYVFRWARVEAVAVVPKRDIRAGEVLKADDFVEVRDTLSPLVGTVATSTGALVGKVAVYDLPAGRRVREQQVEKKVLVRRGERVKVVARVGAAFIQMDARALMPGAAGDEIQLKNIRTHRTIVGTVLEDGTVEVTP